VASVSGSNNGVMTLYKVETATISVTDGTISSSGAGNLTVVVSFSTTNDKLAFTQQPTNTAAGATIGGVNGVQLQVQDPYGNLVSNSSATIGIAIGTNPSSGVLSGTQSLNASGGIATFSNLSINKAGNGYTLTVSSSGLTSATSNAFNITAGTATQLVISTSTFGIHNVSIYCWHKRVFAENHHPEGRRHKRAIRQRDRCHRFGQQLGHGPLL
jgi:hypothetical protein